MTPQTKVPVPISTGGFSPHATLGLVSIGLDADAVEELRQVLADTAVAGLRADLPQYLTGESEARLAAVGEEPDICLIDFDRDRKRAIHTAERIHEVLPRSAVFAISASRDPQRILEAMRSGCGEYLAKPLEREPLLEALARVAGRKRDSRAPNGGRVLLFSGTKGGCGVTTLATHLGAMLAQPLGRKTLLVDLHATLGDAALCLGITQHRYSFYELVESLDRLDDDLLRSFMIEHPGGLRILPAPTGAESTRPVTPEAIGKTIDFVRRRFDLTLIDCPPGLEEQCLELLPRADRLVLVTVAEVSALRNLASCLEFLKRIAFADDKISVVLNRHLRRSAISDEQVERAVRRGITLKIPNKYEEVLRTVNAGDPVGNLSNSEVARTILEWAKELAAESEPAPAKAPQKAGRFLSLFGS